jgi:hypothetical protein
VSNVPNIKETSADSSPDLDFDNINFNVDDGDEFDDSIYKDL